MKKTIATFAGIKIGQRFRVIANTSSHCYPMNTILTFKRVGMNATTMSDIANELYGNSIKISEIELVKTTIEELMKEKEEYLKEIADIDFKIAFCLENGLKEFDENLFKVLKALKVINSFTTDMEKAKEISALLN